IINLKKINAIRCNENVHKCDNFYDSQENVLNYDKFYDSSESINSCGKSFDKIKYDDEDGKLDNTHYSIYSKVQPYNTVKCELPIMDMYRPKKKSIFSRIFKFLRKADTKYERQIYNVLNDDIPENIKNLFVISVASLIFLLVILNGFVSVTIISSLINMLFVFLPIILM
ncbi:Pv-fam-d protein, partial [Plasmodium cynomolgi strain B]